MKHTAAFLGTAATALAWFVATTQADETAKEVEVCVGADRILRFVENPVPCKPDEQRFALLSPSVESELARSKNEKPNEPEKKKDAKPTVTRVTAPFEVIDSAGKVILRVTEGDDKAGGRGAYLYDSSEPAIILATSGPHLLLNNDSALGAWLGINEEAEAFLSLHKGQQVAVELGPGSKNNTALRIFGDSGHLVAAIGVDVEGQGAVRVANTAGATVASMQAEEGGGGVYAISNGAPVAGIVSSEGHGVIAVYNKSTPVAFLGRSSGGDGGNVTVSLNDGSGVFSAGAAQDGAGEACVNRKTQAGTARLACLGLGLPSAGMGK